MEWRSSGVAEWRSSGRGGVSRETQCYLHVGAS